MRLGRLERPAIVFKLDKDQKKAVKTLLDEAFKGAAQARQQLAAAMTRLEMQALGDVLKMLAPDQRASGASPAFARFRGIVLDAKKWDTVPEAAGY